MIIKASILYQIADSSLRTFCQQEHYSALVAVIYLLCPLQEINTKFRLKNTNSWKIRG